MSVHGTLIYHTADDRTDRIGIRTVIKSKMWQASRGDLTQEELDAESPEPPPMPAGVEFIGQQTRPGQGFLRTFWTFEGINGNGKSVTFKGRANSPDYKFDPGFAQVSIFKHPKIRELLETYGGQPIDGQIIWPEIMPATSAKVGLTGSKSQDGKPNPMFGHDDFFRIEGTYTHRYAVPKGVDVPDIGGKIFTTGQLPGDPPRKFTGRNWLGAGCPYQRRGPVLEVEEIYWLSGEGGWTEAIYGKTSGGSGGSGLTTGGLTTGSL